MTRAETGDWLDALSTARASPAAGSAAALTAALGTALLIKLARLTRPEAVPGHDRLLARLELARDRLMTLADADAAAIDGWVRTRRRRDDDPDRRAALQALVDVPLAAAELCHAIRLEVQPLLEQGHAPARPDGQVGVRLLAASQHALCDLVRVNRPVLTDAARIASVNARLEQLSAGSGQPGQSLQGGPAANGSMGTSADAL